MNDDRISRYLQDQAQGITLSPADPAGAARKGNRRRARRRAGLLGSVAVVGLLATSVAVHDGGRDEVVSQLGASATASTFHWSSVTPKVGLGFGGNTTQLADGTVYSLSTAPGPYVEGASSASTLYSSADGAEWAAQTLPSGVRTADLQGSGDTLYSLGTSPAGGLVLSSSDDGASSWTSSDLPSDVKAVQDRHPGMVTLGGARLAAHDSSHLVASITATANLDITKLGHPEYGNGEYSVEFTGDGATVRKNPKAECEAVRRSGKLEDANATADPTVVVPPATADAGDPQSASCRAATVDSGEVVASYTYDELGVDAELQSLIGGKPFVYATTDGTSFEQVDLPAGTTASGWVAEPVAVDDGYRLVLSGNEAEGPSATVLRSTDGTSWTADTVLAGSLNDAGVLGGRAAISLYGKDGSTDLRLQGADGSWSNVDLGSAVTTPQGANTYVENVAFGPLGFAAVVGTSSEDGPYVQRIVHSTDGSTLQVVDVADLIDDGGMVSGIVVTPDAIAVRVTSPDDGKAGTPPTQHVLVGTPA